MQGPQPSRSIERVFRGVSGRIVNSPCAAHHFAATGTLMKGAAALPCEAVKPPAAVQEVSAKRLENVALDWN